MLESLYDLSIEWARKRKLDVKLSCPENIGEISADQTRIKQALMNLIRNAINFTREGGKISISAEKKRDGVEISIKDTGVGISSDDLSRIFEPFVRTPINRGGTANSGAGLGLALVKNIIELHGGSIDIESVENVGTTVTVLLGAL